VKVLVSVVSSDEAEACCDGETDIVDVKNVAEGSLGASFPWIVRDAVRVARQHRVMTSAALGDLSFKPGTASLAAAGLAATGVDFIKAGLHTVKGAGEGTILMQAIARAAREVNPRIKVVAAGYADYRRFGGLDSLGVLRAAMESESDFVMLDTAVKDGTSMFEALADDEIADFVARSHEAGIGVALAGSLRLADVPRLIALSPDIIGVRSAVCRGRDRTNQVDAATVREFVGVVRRQVQAAAGCSR